jgi:hypothetical protein
MRTHRHNAAVWETIDKIKRAHHEQPWHVFVDAGTRFDPNPEDYAEVKKTRGTIPPWALPNCTDMPDIVLVLGWDDSMPVPKTRKEREKVTFVVVDVTYTVGYGAVTAIQRKQEKYKELVTQLRDQGFQVTGFEKDTCRLRDPRENPAPLLSAYSQIGVICLGVSGEVFQSSQYVLEALGLTGSERGTLLTTLHKLTIQKLVRILSTRRKMDHVTDERKEKAAAETQGKNDKKKQKRKATTTPCPHSHNARKTQRRNIPQGIG